MKHPGLKLRRWVEENGYTQAVAGKALGCSQVHISELIGGVRLPGRLLANTIEREAGIRSEEWDAIELEQAGSEAASKRAAKRKKVA